MKKERKGGPRARRQSAPSGCHILLVGPPSLFLSHLLPRREKKKREGRKRGEKEGGGKRREGGLKAGLGHYDRIVRWRPSPLLSKKKKVREGGRREKKKEGEGTGFLAALLGEFGVSNRFSALSYPSGGKKKKKKKGEKREKKEGTVSRSALQLAHLFSA